MRSLLKKENRTLVKSLVKYFLPFGNRESNCRTTGVCGVPLLDTASQLDES